MTPASILDLTYDLGDSTPSWPGDEPFRRRVTFAGETEGGYWCATGAVQGSEHAGTHMDSPSHFVRGGLTIESIAPSQLIGPGVVVDVRGACAADPDYQMTTVDLANFERDHGRIPEGAILLVHTGWGQYWGDRQRFLGTEDLEDAGQLHFPGISEEAARWLVSSRSLKGVGIDTMSLDHGPSRDFVVHRILYGAGLFGLENVACLEGMPPTGATVLVLPVKIKGATGAPARVVAFLP